MPTNEAAAALRRYDAMVARNPTALAWRAIAIRLWAASHIAGAPDRIESVRARADDAHARADRAKHTGNRGRLRAS